MDDAVLIVDLGSTRVKSTLFTPEGSLLAQAAAPFPTVVPRPTWAEQAPAQWWDAVGRATREALHHVGAPTQVAAMGVTGQMHGLVALDRAGAPLGPCLTVQDRRAAAEVTAIEEEVGAERAYAITGARLDAASPAAKLRWLARHQPEILERAVVLMAPKDFLRFRLTGEPATEPIDAAGTLLYDLRAGAWSGAMMDAARIAPHQLPPVLASHSLAGTLTREAATALGLPAGTPVAVGAGDDVECLGAGLLGAGTALEHLGTTGSILASCAHVIADPAMRVDCYPHAVPGLYLVGGSTGSAGATLAWAARHLAGDREGAPGDGSGSLWLGEDMLLDDEDLIVFLPYLAGERCPVWDPEARGILMGMTLHTTRRHITQAVFAGVAFSLRHILDTLLELGLQIKEVMASGDDDGWAGAWPLLRSTVYDRPLLGLATGDATATGALILTLVAAGAAPDIVSAAARVIPAPARRVTPAPAYRPALERRYALYRDLSASTASLFNRWRS